MKTIRILPTRRTILCSLALLLVAAQLLGGSPLLAAQPQPLPQQDALPDAQPVRIFIPVATSGPSFAIPRVELTQAVQNEAQTVPMVEARPTALRVQVRASTPVSNITVQLRATRNGAALAGSPLRVGGVTAPVTPAAGSAQATFLLPAAWLAGSVTFTIDVLPAGSPGSSAQRSVTVAFQPVAPLQVVVVPIRYQHAPTGQSYAPSAANLIFPGEVQAMFPISHPNITVRAAVTFAGDLAADDGSADGNEWGRFYDTVAALKNADGAPHSTVYVGVLPKSAMEDHRFYIAGLGGSTRVAVGLDLPMILAHELGHTLSRRHAPCGGPATTDPAYPYPNAVIGSYGFDVARSRYFDPAQTTDLMSYCEEWVSDYTYVGMLGDQVSVAGAAQASDATSAQTAVAQTEVAQAAAEQAAAVTNGSLLVRAELSPGTAPQILPVYALAQPAMATGSSGVTVALFGADGALLSETPVDLLEAQEQEVTIRRVNVRVALPAAPVARVELRENGVPLAARALGAGAEATAAVTASATAAVEGEALVVRNPSPTPLLVQLNQSGQRITLAVDLAGGELRLPLADLPGGAASLELLAADRAPTVQGMQTSAEPAALSLALADHAPVLELAPVAAPAGSGVVVGAVAWDAEEGALNAIRWSVNGAPAGEGPLLQVALADQPLLVEAWVSDTAGQTVQASLQLQPVSPEPAP